MKKLSFFLFIAVVMAMTTKTANGLKSLPKYPTLLQVSARPWLYELSQERGQTIRSLRDIPEDVFKSIADAGFDMLWVMGVWRVGPYGLKHDQTDEGLIRGFKSLLPDFTLSDVIGSPYAVVNYTCNPELCPAGDNDLVWLRNKLHSYGIRLVLDFVPNHSAVDSPWLEGSGANMYIHAPKDAVPPYDTKHYLSSGIAYGGMQYSDPWTDVAQLNYWNPQTRAFMAQQLKRVASFADGIRCDMAYIVLNDYFGGSWSTELNSWGWSRPSSEFWGSAIKSAKSAYPDTIFIAEVYGEYFKNLISEGFDFTYDKELLDRYRSGHLDNLRGWISYTSQWKDNMCRFLENHDDNRAVSMFDGSVEKTDAAALGTYTLPGMKFFFQDQWYGLKNKLDVHLRRSASESRSSVAYNFYKKFLPIINAEPFKNGVWTNLAVSGQDAWRLMAWSWASKETGEKRLVVVDFSEVSAGGSVVVPDVSGSGTVTITELLSGQSYQRSAEEMRSSGLYVIIDKFNAQIFSYK